MTAGQGIASKTARQQRHAHLQEKLRRELGPGICAALADNDVIEIMANPEGTVWVDCLSVGMQQTEIILSETQMESAIGTVAAMHDHVVHAASPRLKAELPLEGTPRFQGMIRPVSPPTFVIRKHVPRVITLAQHVEAGTLTAAQAAVLIDALRQRRNIIIVGATLSGKTVLADSLMDSMCDLFGDRLRLVVIEDTYELHVTAPNAVHLHTTDTVDVRTLVQDTLRLRPDRIIVGEVRGAEALELLKAWQTGHPGGVTTVHADTAAQALIRLETLIEEAGVKPNPRMIAASLHVIVMMERTGSRAWRVQEILHVQGWDARTQQYLFTELQPQEVSDETMATRRNSSHARTPQRATGMGNDSEFGPAVGCANEHH
jgi:P-type conjugative transfer ATPase TrbB